MNKKKQQGFTLVEIVVVLSIGAIVLSMVGSMIVFSMNMFASGVGEVQDSISISELQDLLKTELESATEIVITQDSDQLPQGKWNSFAITDANGLTQTITKDDNTTNTISFKDFGSLKDEITLKINLENDTSKGKYAKVTITDDISYVVSLINAQFNKTNSDVEIKDDMVLYYKKEPRKVAFTDDSSNSGDSTTNPVVPPTTTPESDSVDPDPAPSGTIEDYIVGGAHNFGSSSNLLGVNSWNTVPLKKGSIYFNKNDGYWYQVLQDNKWIDGSQTGSNAGNGIRRLDPYIEHNKNHFKGEVFIWEATGEYFECLQDVAYYPLPYDENGNFVKDSVNYWKKLDKKPTVKMQFQIEYSEDQEPLETVVDQLDTDVKKYKNMGEYDASKKSQYKVGDMVVITYQAKFGKDYREFYRKIYDYDCEPGKTDNNGKLAWKLYSKQYSELSAYEIGDVLSMTWGSEVRYMQFRKKHDESKSNSWFYGNSWNSWNNDTDTIRIR